MPVPDWEGLYEVSDLGRVYSLRSGKFLKPFPNGRHQYPAVDLFRSGSRKTRKVHHLVLEAFIGPRPEGMECCHANDVKTDNRLSKLRWDTPNANAWDRVWNGHDSDARRTHCDAGHEYTEATCHVGPDGARTCRVCNRERCVRYRAKLARRAYGE